jgi:hypothetical protein
MRCVNFTAAVLVRTSALDRTEGIVGKFLLVVRWRGHHGWHFAPSKNRGPLPAVWASEFSSLRALSSLS